MTSVNVVKYTDEQTENLVSRYLTGSSVDQLAQDFGKTTRSVIAKLAQLGVYKNSEKTSTAPKVTKAQLVSAIAAKLNLSYDNLKTFEKADKPALEALFNAIT